MANKKKTGARPETSERRLKLERAEQRDAEGYSHEHQHWSFEPEFVLHPGDDGLPADADENPTAGSLESICGGVDDSQDVEQYNGTLGVLIDTSAEKLLWRTITRARGARVKDRCKLSSINSERCFCRRWA